MEENYELVIVVDQGGRQYIGKRINETENIINLKDHLKYVEKVMPTQDGQAQIQLTFSPPCRSFVLDTIRLKWLSIEEVNDQEMISAYDKFFTQIRAARAGLVRASQLPSGVPAGMPPGIQVAQR